jgi:hypothetical protein
MAVSDIADAVIALDAINLGEAGAAHRRAK